MSPETHSSPENLPPQTPEEVVMSPTVFDAARRQFLDAPGESVDFTSFRGFFDPELDTEDSKAVLDTNGNKLSNKQILAIFEALQDRGEIALWPDEETGLYAVHEITDRRSTPAPISEPAKRRNFRQRLGVKIHDAAGGSALTQKHRAATVAMPYKAIYHAGEYLGSGQARKEAARSLAAAALSKAQWQSVRKTSLRLKYDKSEQLKTWGTIDMQTTQGSRQREGRTLDYPEIPGYKYVNPRGFSNIDPTYYPLFKDTEVEAVSIAITSRIKENLDSGMLYDDAKEEAQNGVLHDTLPADTPVEVAEALLMAQLVAANLIVKNARQGSGRSSGGRRTS